MDTAREWLGLVCCLALAANALACGYVAWNDSRGTFDKVFSVIFYTLGVMFLGITAVLVAIDGF